MDDDLTPVNPINLDLLANFSEEVKNHRRAAEEEFNLINSQDDKATLEWARAYLRTNFVNAVKRISALVDHAEKDTTSLRAAMFIYNEIKAADNSESDLEKLMKELAANPDPDPQQIENSLPALIPVDHPLLP